MLLAKAAQYPTNAYNSPKKDFAISDLRSGNAEGTAGPEPHAVPVDLDSTVGQVSCKTIPGRVIAKLCGGVHWPEPLAAGRPQVDPKRTISGSGFI